jgi:predicted DNA-binding transcriptional regulator AlpA
MNRDESIVGRQPFVAHLTSAKVVLSPWVNEPLPAWEQLLSAHDLTRLTRRPRWLLMSLMLFGRFPRRVRYHGRSVGWLRAEVSDWLTGDSPAACAATRPPRPCSRQRLQQLCLPLERGRPCGIARSHGSQLEYGR